MYNNNCGGYNNCCYGYNNGFGYNSLGPMIWILLLFGFGGFGFGGFGGGWFI